METTVVIESSPPHANGEPDSSTASSEVRYPDPAAQLARKVLVLAIEVIGALGLVRSLSLTPWEVCESSGPDVNLNRGIFTLSIFGLAIGTALALGPNLRHESSMLFFKLVPLMAAAVAVGCVRIYCKYAL